LCGNGNQNTFSIISPTNESPAADLQVVRQQRELRFMTELPHRFVAVRHWIASLLFRFRIYLKYRGLWFPVSQWLIGQGYRASLGRWLNLAFDRRSLGGPWISEAYQFLVILAGLAWLAFIDRPLLVGLWWSRAGALLAFYRPLEIFLFSLHWLLVAEGPVKAYRRSLIGFLLNLCEIGVFFAIGYLLLDWFDPPLTPLRALSASLRSVFTFSPLSEIAAGSLPKIAAVVQVGMAWLLGALILANVVGAIGRGEQANSE